MASSVIFVSAVLFSMPISLKWAIYLSSRGIFPVMPAPACAGAGCGGHPAFSAEHFWIPACAGMTSFD
jgi:hypothetical protein